MTQIANIPLHDLASANNHFAGRPSLRASAGTALFQLVKGALWFGVYLFLNQWWANAWQLLAVAWTWLALRWAWDTLRLQCIHYEIEGDRIHIKEGVLSRMSTSIEIFRIRNITLQQGLLDRLLDVGNLYIESFETFPTITMIGMKEPDPMRRWLTEYVQANRRANGVPEIL